MGAIILLTEAPRLCMRIRLLLLLPAPSLQHLLLPEALFYQSALHLPPQSQKSINYSFTEKHLQGTQMLGGQWRLAKKCLLHGTQPHRNQASWSLTSKCIPYSYLPSPHCCHPSQGVWSQLWMAHLLLVLPLSSAHHPQHVVILPPVPRTRTGSHYFRLLFLKVPASHAVCSLLVQTYPISRILEYTIAILGLTGNASPAWHILPVPS